MLKSVLLLLIYTLVRLLMMTYRFRTVGLRPDAAGTKGAQGYVLAIWHQNLFAGILAQTGHRHTVIVSKSRDGDPVTFICKRLGHYVVRGSSRRGDVDKGGKLAKDEMIQVLRTGVPGAVTVDGPCGPAHEVKPGVIEMARLAEVPIIPYVPIPERYWRFNSWDQFRLPKPFSKIHVHYGVPIPVPPDAGFSDFEGYQLAVTRQLQAIEAEHHRLRGPRVRVAPSL